MHTEQRAEKWLWKQSHEYTYMKCLRVMRTAILSWCPEGSTSLVEGPSYHEECRPTGSDNPR
eukprot:4708773-Heterocapsa_arctica.AAC.1